MVPIYPDFGENSLAEKQRKTKTRIFCDHLSPDAYRIATRDKPYDYQSIASANRRLLI